ncbi:phage exclusion lipoprotein Cor [Trabulsiella odontotermitis]|uniref:Cor protein n=1 Tax=Trabulsiella odontotermitis TaxID=379893 RepID=A0A0L0GJ07_9ENTR|nr:hypothetical protein [Trabulsiella odontotermitis]KNC88313.1 cor protein [Trabulsiella odontotermitis]
MTKLLLFAAVSFMLTGCAGVPEKQTPVCQGTAIIGGQETTVEIYGMRKVGAQTQYRAGPPFSWHWVSKNNFTSTTCK